MAERKFVVKPLQFIWAVSKHDAYIEYEDDRRRCGREIGTAASKTATATTTAAAGADEWRSARRRSAAAEYVARGDRRCGGLALDNLLVDLQHLLDALRVIDGAHNEENIA